MRTWATDNPSPGQQTSSQNDNRQFFFYICVHVVHVCLHLYCATICLWHPMQATQVLFGSCYE